MTTDRVEPVFTRLRPTGTGRALVVVAAGAVVAGWAGLGAAFGYVGALGLGVVAAAAFATWRQAGRLAVGAPEPATGTAGKPIVLGVTLANDGGAAARDIVLTLLRPGAPSSRMRMGAFVPHLAPGEAVRTDATGPSLRRGRHPQGDVEIETSAPVGLFVWRARFELPNDVLVLPRPLALRADESGGAGLRTQEFAGRRARGDEQEYRALHEWRTGECQRRVHWKASARRARLLVREFEGEPRPPVHVVLSCALDRTHRRARARFEDAVSVAAALASKASREGHALRVTLLGRDARSVRIPRGTGAGAALRALAEAEPAAPAECRPFASLDRPVRAGEMACLVRVGPGESVPQAVRVLDADDPAVRRRLIRPSRRGARRSPGEIAETALADPGPALRGAAWIASAIGGVGATVALATAIQEIRGGGYGVEGRVWRAAFLGLFVASAVVQSLLVARRRTDASLHLRTLWTMPLLALVAAVFVGSALAGAAVPAAVALLVAGLAFSQAADVRRRAARSLSPDAVRADEPSVVRRRTLTASLTAAHALVLALLLLPAATYVLPPSQPALRGSSAAAGSHPPGGTIVDPNANGDAGLLGRTLLLEVEAFRGRVPAGDVGPLYLRGIVCDRLARDGTWTEQGAPRSIRDADDGAADGVCTFRAPPPDAEALALVVRQAALGHSTLDGTIVHVPAGAARVGLPAFVTLGGDVATPGDGTLLVPWPAADKIEYGVTTELASMRRFPGGLTRAARGPTSSLELPASPVARAFADDAAAATAGAKSDAARVRAVLDHLRTSYRYEELDSAAHGFAALAEFRAQRQGTCVQFAEAAAVMLRSAGMPARVVQGFLAKRFDRDRGCYFALGVDYHAWVEVRFEGLGWVTVDATPEVPDASRGGGEDDGAGPALARILAAVTENGFAWGVLALGVAALAALVVWRLRAARRAANAAGGFVPPPVWDRILARLAALGLVRGPAQTALEFAAVVAAGEGGRLAAFVALTRREQAARFGGQDLSPADLEAFEAFRASI